MIYIYMIQLKYQISTTFTTCLLNIEFIIALKRIRNIITQHKASQNEFKILYAVADG